jgi:carbon monoxide dehydrogenase subunit G
MPTITDEIVIGAPIEEVFEYLSKPENHPEIIPSLIAIDNVEELPNGGYEVDVTNQLLGKTFEGHLRDIEVAPPNRRVYEIDGDVKAHITYTLMSENGATRFIYTNEFESPEAGLLERLASPLVKRALRRDVDTMLKNTKMILEAE